MPVEDVPAPEDADFERSFDSQRMIFIIHPQLARSSGHHMPGRPRGVFEDLQLAPELKAEREPLGAHGGR